MAIRFLHRASAALFGIASIAGVLTMANAGAEPPPTIDGASRKSEKHRVAVTRSVVLPKTPQIVFGFIAAEDVLPKVLTGYGPLPGVVRTSRHTGPWDRPGSARVIHLADGNTVREQVTRYDRSKHFAYRVWDFSHPLIGSLADEAHGEWTFASHPGGTLVTWTYTFTAKNAAAAIPLTLIAKIFWRGYMDVCLENSRRLL
jgi:hypothetical protein